MQELPTPVRVLWFSQIIACLVTHIEGIEIGALIHVGIHNCVRVLVAQVMILVFLRFFDPVVSLGVVLLHMLAL